jgi:hypothetical protein
MLKRGKRSAWVVLGTVALALGVVGMIVPVLPTTPFLLLAAAAYARGSTRLHDRLVNNRLLGEPIRDYRDRRAIKLVLKVYTIAMLWVFIGVSVVAVDVAWIRVLLVVIATAVTAHILTLRTIMPGAARRPLPIAPRRRAGDTPPD